MDDVTNHKTEKNETENHINPHLFVPKVILNNGRFACVQGEIKGETSLLLLEHREFEPSHLLEGNFNNSDIPYEKVFNNDIYSKYIVYPIQPANGTKATIVSPCTQKHINKYRQQAIYFIQETAENYKTLTLPHLLEDQFNLQWVYNIISGEQEADRVIYKDESDVENGFVLALDSHWDGLNVNQMHLLAIPYERDILSIRNLTNKNLPLLYHMRNKILEAVKEKYKLSVEQLRLYFHYQPTFYHLHVHVTNITNEAPGINIGKAHLLDTVINNIELLPNYYQLATLPFTVRETDSLFKKYKELAIVNINEETIPNSEIKIKLIN